MTSEVDIFLQARMGSTRLPGKTMMELVPGLTLLDACVERLQAIENKGRIVLVTTVLPDDDAIEQYGAKKQLLVHRGDPEHVLPTFFQATRLLKCLHVLRATADNPLVDHEEANKLIELHLQSQADYSTNRSEKPSGLPVGLPVGVGVEIFKAEALERIFDGARTEAHWVHINDYIFDNKDEFRIRVLPAPKDKYAPNLELTVDTAGQMERMREIFRSLAAGGNLINISEVIKLLAAESFQQ